jgi:hypothetical protein
VSLTFGTDLLARLLPAWLPQVWEQQNTRYAALLLIVTGVFFVLTSGASKKQSPAHARSADDEPIKRDGNSPWLQRVRWRLLPPDDVMRVDGLAVARNGKASHCLWLGPTGAGKSASVATVRVDGARPTLIITPDLSDPMIEACARLGGFHWTACTPGIAVDFLIGTPGEVAERLTEVFRSGGNGVWKMTTRRAVTLIIDGMDARGEHRSLQRIGELLQEVIRDDRELKQACSGWVERFLSTALALGDSIRADGEDLADLLNDGQTVLLDNDAFKHTGIKGDVVAFGLAEAKRCAELVPGGFRLIFEEAQQLEERIDLADPFFLAGRRRQIAVDALAQSEDALDDAITQNSHTRVYFAQRRKSLQKAADDVLDVGHRQLDPAVMRDYTAWVSSGKIRRLVHFPKPPKGPPSAADGNTREERMGETDSERRMVPRYVVREVPQGEPERREEQPALPPPSTVVAKILDSLYPQSGCERWGGKHDREGHVRGCKSDCRTRHAHRVGCGTDCAIVEHVNACYGLIWLDGRRAKVRDQQPGAGAGRTGVVPTGRTEQSQDLAGQ